jgi:hypothetical protein
MPSNAAASDGIRRRRELLAGFNPQKGKEARAICTSSGSAFLRSTAFARTMPGASRAAADVHHAIMT